MRRGTKRFGRLRFALFLAAVATWVFLLRGFVSVPWLMVLSLVGAVLAGGGLSLTIVMALARWRVR